MLQNAILDTLLIAFSNFDISWLSDTQHEYNWQTFFRVVKRGYVPNQLV